MMAKKIKSYKDADVWYTRDKQGVEKWTVITPDSVEDYDNELAALEAATPKVKENLNLVSIDDQVMLSPRKGVWGDDQQE
jgi:hypothetical protein